MNGILRSLAVVSLAGGLASCGTAQEEPIVPELSGHWNAVGPFGGLDEPPPDREPAVLTEKGQAAADAYDPRDNPVFDCVAPGLPNVIGVPYMVEITQRENEVIIRHEYFDVVRTVRLDTREYSVEEPRTKYGVSLGRYEDNALVVETRRFAFDPNGTNMGGGVPSGEQKYLIERYTRSDDGQYLRVEYVVEDPEYLSEPHTRAREWIWAPELELYEFECEPEYARKTREYYDN